jgi:hypothetical protein
MKANRKPMKLVTKSLSILAIGGIFAGTALAGPGDAYLGSHAASVAKASAKKKAEYFTIALFRPRVTPAGEKAKAKKRLVPSGIPKVARSCSSGAWLQVRCVSAALSQISARAARLAVPHLGG